MIINGEEYEKKKIFFRIYTENIDVIYSEVLDSEASLSDDLNQRICLEGIASIEGKKLSVVEEDFISYSFGHILFQIESTSKEFPINIDDSEGRLYYYDETHFSMQEPIVKVYVPNDTLNFIIDALKKDNVKMEIGIYANLFISKSRLGYESDDLLEKIFIVNKTNRAVLANFSIREEIQKSIPNNKNQVAEYEVSRANLGINYVDKWIEEIWDWADENHIPSLSTDDPFDYRDDSFWVGLGRDKKQFLTTRIINLQDNKLTDLPKSIFNLSKMTKLNLYNNSLTEIPNEISYAKRLTELNIGRNYLTVFPECILNLTNLTKLDICRNRLNELPKEIHKLKSLTELNIDSNQFNKLPKEIYTLINLTELDIGSNELAALHKDIENLTKLIILKIISSKLTTLPKEIGKLKNLKELYLWSNKLVSLPDEIGDLINLTYLDLGSNNLFELPKGITKLTKLTYLNLSNMDKIILTKKQQEWINNLTGKGCSIKLSETPYVIEEKTLKFIGIPVENASNPKLAKYTSINDDKPVENSDNFFKNFIKWIK